MAGLAAVDVMWTVSRADLTGAERCAIGPLEDGWALSGVIVVSWEERPIDARYWITVDGDWATRSVAVTVDDLTQPRRLQLDRSANGNWTINGAAAPNLDGCVDVDLGITPLTNTLPIRRLDLDIGTEQQIDVAWVKFPDLHVERGRQAYARVSANTWQYSSGDFTAELTVDGAGLVVRYGHDLWRQVAIVR